MPELPDLTLYAKNLRKRILNLPIHTAEVFNLKKVNVPPAAFKQAVVGHVIEDIQREGKELYFHLSGGEVFAVHLMLFGKFTLVPAQEVHRIYSKIITLGFEDGNVLVISDFKGMCKVTLHPPKPLAPDALSDDFTPGYLQKTIQKNPNANIKGFLINQKMVRGIGNAYVDEILWKADISPKSVAGKIPPEELPVLYEAIRWVMTDAIEQLERLTPDAISGEERSFLRVHKPNTPTDPSGEVILCEEVEKKRTYYTKRQRLFW